MTELSVSVSNASGPVPQVTLPEAAPKVTARGLNFYYGEHHALKNINLTLGTHRVTAFMYLGELIEFDTTSRIFTAPNDRRTQDYITGRFG